MNITQAFSLHIFLRDTYGDAIGFYILGFQPNGEGMWPSEERAYPWARKVKLIMRETQAKLFLIGRDWNEDVNRYYLY